MLILMKSNKFKVNCSTGILLLSLARRTDSATSLLSSNPWSSSPLYLASVNLTSYRPNRLIWQRYEHSPRDSSVLTGTFVALSR
jgi:hypothetical protein